jgi:nucleotide-binding universal stress UspA family protein
VRVAHKRYADLIVIGTHKHTGLQHVLLGSVAKKAVRLAPCPVLMVIYGAQVVYPPSPLHFA